MFQQLMLVYFPDLQDCLVSHVNRPARFPLPLFFAPVMQDRVDEINARDHPITENAEEEEEEEANENNEEDSNYSTALYNLFCHHFLQAFNFWPFFHHSPFVSPAFFPGHGRRR